MPTKIEQLKQAGYSDEEIGDWTAIERMRMQAAGFSASEIDDDLGVTRPPPEVPPTYIERLKQGNAFQRIIGTTGEYTQNYFGGEPLGFSPKNEQWAQKFGILGDLSIPAVRALDALWRSVPAGIGGASAGIGQAVEEAIGTGGQASGKAARDFAQLGQIAALVLGLRGTSAGPTRARVPEIANEPVIPLPLPRAEDFRNAAASVTETAASYPAEQKLLRIWTDHGIHPLEVADDAMRDRTIADSIRSRTDELPAAYVRQDRAPAASGAQTGTAAQAAEPDRPGETHAPAKPLENPKEETPLPEPQNPDGEGTAAAPAERISPRDEIRAPELPDAHGETPTASSEPNSIVPETASRTADNANNFIHQPPRLMLRAFSRDYPNRVRTDAQGRLLTDMEGRPLEAEFIAGRRRPGEVDKALSPADIRTAAKQRLGIEISLVPPSFLPQGTAGQYFQINSKKNGLTRHIWVSDKYPPFDRNMITAHEFGHAIDYIVGELSNILVPNEIAELRRVYGTLRSGSAPLAFLYQPELVGYQPHKVNKELVAEGVRAYMTNPNYFKTVAPKTAISIRSLVNNSPILRKIIQFNSLTAAGLMGAGSARDPNKDDR